MKKLMFLLCLGLTPLTAYDFLEINKLVLWDKAWSYVIEDGRLFHLDDEAETVTEITDIVQKENGYTVITRNEREILFIPGEEHFEEFPLSYYRGKEYKERKKKEYPQTDSGMRSNLYISKIESSSFYTETLKGVVYEYSADNLLNRFVPDCVCHPLNYNDMTLPWVAGGKGPGESLDIHFTEPQSSFTVLNGFISLSNPELYKDNSRMKTVKITSAESDFVVEYEFTDIVHFAQIRLPESVSSVKLEITEVYPGSKYSDTCVSAVFAGSKAVHHDYKRFLSTHSKEFFSTINQ